MEVQILGEVSEGHRMAAVASDFSFDGSLFCTAGADKQAFIYSTKDLSQIARLSDHHSSGLNACSFLMKENNLIVTASDDGTVKIIDVEMNKVLTTFRTGKHLPLSLVIHPFNGAISVGDTEGNLLFFHHSTKEMLNKFFGHRAPITSLEYDREGERLLSGSLDGVVREWSGNMMAANDVFGGGCLRSIVPSPVSPKPISKASYSPDGQYILIGSFDDTLRLYDPLHTGEAPHITSHIREYRGHVNHDLCLPSYVIGGEKDDYIISSSETGKIHFWSINGEPILDQQIHEKACLTISPHPLLSGVFLSGAIDGTVKLWQVYNT